MAKIITLTDLNEMEEEIFHYYLCAFPIQGLWAFKSSYSLDQKKLIVADILLDRKYDDDARHDQNETDADEGFI